MRLWHLIGEGIDAFIADEALTRGAAIAFYAATAIAPTLFIAITVASLGFGRAAAGGAIAYQLSHLMGRDSAALLQLAIRHAPGTSTGIFNGVVGFLALILTASGVFGEMEDALNVIWRAPRKGSVLRRLLRGRAVSLALVIGLGFLLLTSMVFTAGIAAFGHYIDNHTSYSQVALALINFTVSIVLMALLFAAIFKILPNKDLEWRDVGAGALGTALLFQLGQFLIGTYLGNSSLATPYGAAGGLIVMLLWVYYSAQVFLLGAEFTKVFACHFGSQQSAICDTPPVAQAA
ncbi:MAG TPA: YihY/virulence factor BrkB family protein [Rhizomicrobium sp.]|nr:YihY/virulence factor BrkB family protein [Rhizomicrobium sp.]